MGKNRMNYSLLKQRGFTLLEILAAFTILALFVSAAFQAFSAGMGSSVRTLEYAKAQILAQSRLETMASSPSLTIGTEQGQWEPAGHTPLQWKTRVEPIEEAGLLTLFATTVEVSWPDENKADSVRQFVLQTKLARPQ